MSAEEQYEEGRAVGYEIGYEIGYEDGKEAGEEEWKRKFYALADRFDAVLEEMEAHICPEDRENCIGPITWYDTQLWCKHLNTPELLGPLIGGRSNCERVLKAREVFE